jgi:ABC-type Fe3+-hydroxamate transport system substrate-binding protein
MRIVCTVPSITELLYDLGLESQIVGVTKFCVKPAHLLRQISPIGGTKTLNIVAIEALKPSLVIANKEENTKADIEAIAAFCKVYVTEIKTISDALLMIEAIGQLTHTETRAAALIAQINAQKQVLEQLRLQAMRRPTVVYLIWQKPYMTIGGDTFIHAMLEMSGFNNLFSTSSRYPVLSVNDLIDADPDHIFLSSEPFPFKQKHLHDIQLLCPRSQLSLVDGEAFSWYGTRLIHSFPYLCQLIGQ